MDLLADAQDRSVDEVTTQVGLRKTLKSASAF